jgi:glucose-6-phosphate isomerase
MHEREYAIYEYKDSIMRLEEEKQELEGEKVRQRRRAVQATFEQEVIEWRECFTNGTRLSYRFMKNVLSPELLAFLQLDDEEQDDLKH